MSGVIIKQEVKAAVMEKWDEIDRYVVISSDSHAGADLRDYREYLPKKWHEEFDAWADTYVSPFDDLIHATAHRNWDSDFRKAENDADGVAGELLFPNTIPPFFPTSALIVVNLPKTEKEFSYRWAGVQAHNRWVVDFVNLLPTRRRAVAQIFPNDVEAAVKEIRWAKETGVFGGVLLATVPPGHVLPGLYHERYEPIWAVCDELDMPIVTHNQPIPDMPMDQPCSKALTIMQLELWCRATMMEILISGVLERHPTLKVIPTELGFEWVRDAAKGMEAHLPALRMDAPNRSLRLYGHPDIDNLSLSPTGYVDRNFYYGVSGAHATQDSFERRHVFGVDRMMWGSDYPHEEGTAPTSKELIRWAFNDIPVEETRLMLGGNAARVYGFDIDALVPIAKEIGPSVELVHTPLTPADFEKYPNPVPEFAPRPFAGGALLERGREADSHF